MYAYFPHMLEELGTSRVVGSVTRVSKITWAPISIQCAFAFLLQSSTRFCNFSQLKRGPRDQGLPYRWVRFVLPGAAMNPAAALLAGMRPPMLNPLLAAGLRPGGLPGLPSMPGASLRSEKLDTLRDEP